ncbi:MAG TPA: MarR family transcriptional regulator [Acidimicrobiia bacterium]
MDAEPSTTDRLDHILETWRTSRPEIDFSPFEVGTRVLRAAHFLQARLDRIAAAYGLSHQGDLDVLTKLDLVGPLTPSELAEDLLLTSGGMTVRLNRLQTAGLIERQPNPHDGRGVLIYLTPAGKDLAEDALTNLLQAHTEIVGSLEPSDRDHLTQLLRTLLTRLGDTPAFSPTIMVKREKR